MFPAATPKHRGTETLWAVMQRMLYSTNQKSQNRNLSIHMALPRQHGAGQPADHIMLWIMVYNSWSHQPTCLWIQLPGVEGHLLKETSLCYGHQDLQLNYTTSPYNSSCPVLISLDNYIFLRAEGN